MGGVVDPLRREVDLAVDDDLGEVHLELLRVLLLGRLQHRLHVDAVRLPAPQHHRRLAQPEQSLLRPSIPSLVSPSALHLLLKQEQLRYARDS